MGSWTGLAWLSCVAGTGLPCWRTHSAPLLMGWYTHLHTRGQGKELGEHLSKGLVQPEWQVGGPSLGVHRLALGKVPMG